MRAIDADALKNSIDACEICNVCPDKKFRCDYDCDAPDCLTPKWEAFIDAQPTIDIQTWIPCSERLPEERLIVLVSFEEIYGLPSIGITYYNKGKWEDALYREVVAWMPLPESYKEGE